MKNDKTNSLPVPGGLCSTSLPSNTTGEFSGVYEEIQEYRLSDWLKLNGYPEEGSKLDSCSLQVEHWQCQNGHDFYFRKYCGREYCPICGTKGSYYHRRRTSRASDHFIWPLVWGNLTYTMPKEISEKRLTKEQLRKLQKLAWEVSRDVFQLEGAMVVVHLLGEKSEGLHVHFEVLFMRIGCFHKGKVEPEKLLLVKTLWAQGLNGLFNTKLDTTDVRYSFATTKPRKWHKLNYILRPICTEEKMIRLSEPDRHYILSLFGYHRTRYFGELANSRVHKFLRKHWAPIVTHNTPMIERRVCPMCKTKMKYQDRLFIDHIPMSQVVRYSNDIWMDRAVDTFLRQENQEAG